MYRFCCVIGLLLLVFLGNCSENRRLGPAASVPAVFQIEELAAEGARFAVLVSVNSYADPSKTPTLSGPKNDLDRMAEVLLEKYGFAADAVLRLHGPSATRQGIVLALQALEARARPGRQLLFAFAGHGSFMADRELTEEANGQDETICPFDRDLAAGGDLSDDLLYGYFSRFLAAGAYLTVILDSCYSGNASKGGSVTARTAPPLAIQTSAGAATSVAEIRAYQDRLTVLAAAEEQQTAGEMYFEAGLLPAGSYGLFSHALNIALRQAPPHTTWNDLSVFLKGEVRRYDDYQRPIFRGGLQNRVFGISAGRERHRFRISRVESRGAVIQLENGSMSGLTLGSLLAVYSQGQPKGPEPRRANAWYRVIEVDARHAAAALIPEKSSAAEKVVVGNAVAHVPGGGASDKRRVFLDDTLAEPFRAAFLNEVADDPELQPVTDSANMAKTYEDFRIAPAQNDEGEPILQITGPTAPIDLILNDRRVRATAQEARDHLIRLVYRQKLRDIRNPDSEAVSPPIQIELERGRVTDQGFGLYERLDPLPLDPESGQARFQECDLLRLSYTNRSENPLFVTVFYFTNQGELIAWNQDQYDALLSANQKVVVTDWVQICPPLGARWLKLFVNRKRPFDPQPFIQGSKDPNLKVAEHIEDLGVDWWAVTLEFQSLTHDEAEKTCCREEER